MERYQPDSSTRVMSREEVRAFDAWAISTLKIPGVVLMENAGRNCAELIKQELPDVPHPKVCIFCGAGNNGGDGYVIARHLMNAQIEVCVVLCAPRAKVKGDAATNLTILENQQLGINTLKIGGASIEPCVRAHAQGSHLIVDAIFGSGLHGTLDAQWSLLLDTINACHIPIIAVDCPSGLDCNTGLPLGAAIRAHSTVSFVAIKQGFVKPGAAEYVGALYVASIGIVPNEKS